MSASQMAKTRSITTLKLVQAKRLTTDPREVKIICYFAIFQYISFSHQKLLFTAKINELMSADVQSRKILKNLKENNLVPQSLKAKPLVQHMYRERIESKTVQRPGNVFALKFTLCFRTKKCIFALNYSLVRIEMINGAIKQANIV